MCRDLRNFVEIDVRLPQGVRPEDIHGRLSKLFRVKNPQKYSVAIWAIAAASLRNIVVSSAAACTQLLDRNNNCFNGFERLVPLDKIAARVELASTVSRIRKVTEGKAELALNLITYDKIHEPALGAVFGAVFVADDQATARRISTDNNPVGRFTSCTVQGDMYRADGVLSGGHQAQASRLDQIHEYARISGDVAAGRKALTKTE